MTKDIRSAARKVSAIALIVAGLSSVQAMAQDATGDTSTPAAAAPVADGLDEIVVTAQRRTQDLQTVPIAITAVSQATIENLNIRNIDKIATVTTGLIYETGYSFVQTYIRGIGVANAPGVGLEAPVALYIDGAYMPRGTGTIFDLVDMQSVEVLKGPQGTLYGHNASGGAILLRSADPTDIAEGQVSAEYGRFDHVMLDGMVNVPLADTLSLRVAGRYRKDGGFVRNLVTGEDVRGKMTRDARVKLKFEPDSAFTAIAAFDYHFEVGNANASGRQIAGLPYCIGCLFGATPGDADAYEVTEDFRRRDYGKSLNGNLRLQLVAGDLTVQSITNYRDLYGYISDDSDHTSAPLFVYDALYGGKTFSQDLQVTSATGGWLDFLAGVQYINDKAYQHGMIYGLAFGLPYDNTQVGRRQSAAPEDRIEATQNVTTNSYAAYAELYLRPIENLTVTLGGRYSKDRRSINTVDNEYAVMFLNPGGDPEFSQKGSWSKFTPRAVIAYDIGRVNAYASFTRGFKSGGFNVPSFAPQVDPINPEVIDSYEIGAKFLSADRRTRINLAAFRYDYNDAQVSLIGDDGASQIIRNAASARGKGVELDASQRIGEGLTFSGGLSYLDAKYRNYPNAAVYKFVFDENDQIVGIATGNEDLSGTPLPRSPKWSGFVAAAFETPVADEWLARLNAVTRFSRSYLFNPGAGGDLQSDRQSSYAIVNMSGAVGPISQDYEVGFYVDNLFSEKYASTTAAGGFGIVTMIAPPVTYGIRAKARF